MKTIQELQRELEAHPKEYSYYRALADAFVDNNEPAEAIHVFERYLEIDTTNAEVYNNLGTLYFILKDAQKAEQFLIDGLKKDPSNLDIICNLRDVYAQVGRLDASLGMIERYAEITKDPKVYRELAETYKKFGNYQKMIEMEQKYYLFGEKA